MIRNTYQVKDLLITWWTSQSINTTKCCQSRWTYWCWNTKWNSHLCTEANLLKYVSYIFLHVLWLITARKRSLGQGNIFTPVCHSVHGGGGRAWLPGGWRAWLPGGAWLLGGMHGWQGGACMVKGGMHGEGGVVHGKGGACMAKGGMHGKRGAWWRGWHVWRRGVCVAKGGHAWWRGDAWQKGGCGMHPPRDTAGHCAGGTHPTGMHSCLILHLCNKR